MSVFSPVRSFFIWLKDGLFPRFCVGCQKEGTWACASCREGARFYDGEASLAGLRDVIAGYWYADPLVKGTIRALKFSATEELQPVLTELTHKAAQRSRARLPKDPGCLVVPVPTTPRRRRERGFDQVHWIAEELALALSMSCAPILAIAQSHERQSHQKTDEARRKNIRDAFRVTEGVTGKRIILVDDVVTSGATLEEAARVLRAAGAVDVWAFALARGGKKNAILP